MKPSTIIKKAMKKVEEARQVASDALLIALRDATKGMAAEYPGHRVSAVSAMGSWTLTVYDLYVDEDGEDTDSNNPDGWKKDVVFGSGTWCDRTHPVFDLFDDVWDDLKTYPTIRFDVDVAGQMTETTDW